MRGRPEGPFSFSCTNTTNMSKVVHSTLSVRCWLAWPDLALQGCYTKRLAQMAHGVLKCHISKAQMSYLDPSQDDGVVIKAQNRARKSGLYQVLRG